MAGFFQDKLNSQTYKNSARLPPNNPVSSATLSSMPALGAASIALNPGVTASLIGGVAAQAAAAYPSVVGTGYGVITDASGNVNAGIGVLAKTPQQLEAAGILKPGAAALVTGLVQQGMNVQAAMTNNLFTGVPGAENLQAFINNVPAQASAQIVNFQQAQTAMTMVGAIRGNEAPTAIAGIINAASQVGVKATVEFLQNTVPSAPSIGSPYGSTIGSPDVSARTVGAIATGIGGS
jgi:hypothetical protein